MPRPSLPALLATAAVLAAAAPAHARLDAPARAEVVPADVAAAPASRALGEPYDRGRLLRGVQLPAEGTDFVTWDAPLQRAPSRGWRRWGTDVLVATIFEVLAEHRTAHPEAPRVLVGDLSRPRGGVFDRRYGGLGHASHQNGLDVDVYYPRRDRRLREPRRPSQVDRVLARDLVNRFLAAGAEVVYVGRRVGIRPRARVEAIDHHEDHLHVRLANPARPGT